MEEIEKAMSAKYDNTHESYRGDRRWALPADVPV